MFRGRYPSSALLKDFFLSFFLFPGTCVRRHKEAFLAACCSCIYELTRRAELTMVAYICIYMTKFLQPLKPHLERTKGIKASSHIPVSYHVLICLPSLMLKGAFVTTFSDAQAPILLISLDIQIALLFSFRVALKPLRPYPVSRLPAHSTSL